MKTVDIGTVYKRLSGLGFIYSEDNRAWTRARDDAAVSDESIRDIVETWPPIVVGQCLKLLETGASFVVTTHIDHDTGAMTITVAREAARGDDD